VINFTKILPKSNVDWKSRPLSWKLGSEVKLGVQDGFSDLDVSGRTRGVFSGASRFAGSAWIGVLSATDVSHLAFDDVVDASKFGLVRASFWGATVVDSFESSATSLSVQNFYLAEFLQWALNISARAVGFSETVEKVSEGSINSAFQ
jgi:hypothetical protein